MSSIYDKIKSVRKPRVQISYELEDGGATVKKELPFVVGVLGDFSGDTPDKKNLKQRKFVNIDGGSFNKVMSSLSPRVKTKVTNTLKNDGTKMALDLVFNSMEDFEPGKVAMQVPALKKLLDVRKKIQELLSKAERSEELEVALEKILSTDENLKEVMDKMNSNEDQEGKEDEKKEE